MGGLSLISRRFNLYAGKFCRCALQGIADRVKSRILAFIHTKVWWRPFTQIWRRCRMGRCMKIFRSRAVASIKEASKLHSRTSRSSEDRGRRMNGRRSQGDSNDPAPLPVSICLKSILGTLYLSDVRYMCSFRTFYLTTTLTLDMVHARESTLD